MKNPKRFASAFPTSTVQDCKKIKAKEVADYIHKFDRLNGLKSVPYRFQGKVILNETHC